jgi:hypothetical protein
LVTGSGLGALVLGEMVGLRCPGEGNMSARVELCIDLEAVAAPKACTVPAGVVRGEYRRELFEPRRVLGGDSGAVDLCG